MGVQCLDRIPAVHKIISRSDRVHVKTVVCDKALREFVAAMLSYMPVWMRFLYWVRGYFVTLLGNSQDSIPQKEDFRPEGIGFNPGDSASFFTVVSASEEAYWVAEARDKMIAGYLGVIVDPMDNGAKRFHVLTTAEYLHWTGRIYFNLISVFHLIVVGCMSREAAKT